MNSMSEYDDSEDVARRGLLRSTWDTRRMIPEASTYVKGILAASPSLTAGVEARTLLHLDLMAVARVGHHGRVSARPSLAELASRDKRAWPVLYAFARRARSM